MQLSAARGFELKVRVYAAPFLDLSALDDDGCVTLALGSTVDALYKKLKIPLPLRPLIICQVNQKKAKRTDELIDGDTVSLFGIIAGG